MKIPYNGHVYNLIYSEISDGVPNTIVYAFDRFDNAFAFMKEMVEHTRKNLDELHSTETQNGTHDVKWEDPHRHHEYASICVDENLNYTFELRRIPVFTSATYDFFGGNEKIELTED